MAVAIVAVGWLGERTTRLEIELVRASWRSSREQVLREKSSALARGLARPLDPLLDATTIDQIAERTLAIPEVRDWAVLSHDGRRLAPREGRPNRAVIEEARALITEEEFNAFAASLESLPEGDAERATRPYTELMANGVPFFGRRERFALWVRIARRLTEAGENASAASAYLDALNELELWTDPPLPQLVNRWRDSVLTAMETLPVDRDSPIYQTAVANRERDRDTARRVAEQDFFFREAVPHAVDAGWTFGGTANTVLAVRRTRLPVKAEDQPWLLVELDATPRDLVPGAGVLLLRSESPETSAAPVTVPLTDFVPGWWLTSTAARAPGLDAVEGRGWTLRFVVWIVGALLLVGFVLLWRAEEKRARLERLRTDLATNLSHELRTPLAVLRLSAESLANRELEPEKRRRYLASLLEETRQLNALVDDVMQLASEDRAGDDQRREVVDLRQIASNLVDAFAPRLDDVGFETSINAPAEALRVRANPTELARAVSNLIDNAIVHGKSGKRLDLVLRREGDRAVVEIRDRGPGVPAPQRDAIFERFRRLEDPLTATTSGLGVGLSIARDIVERHGGTIECRENRLAATEDGGRSVASGALFRIQLPLAEEAP